jgi:type VI secretion system secreted protein VgrG
MPRSVHLTSPLQDTIEFRRLAAFEALSQLFEFELDVVSERGDIRPDEVLGKPFTVSVEIDGDRKRHFHGYAVRMESTPGTGRSAGYRVTLRPWLWFLTRTSDCRIFQGMNVPAILRAVFDTEHTAEIELKGLSANYDPWVYGVQYRETDFNFVSRLMEQEGIGYWFEHSASVHTLKLFDNSLAHPAIDGGASVTYRDETRGVSDRDHIHTIGWSHEIQPAVYAIDDYDFLRPGGNLDAVRRAERKPTHAKAEYEIYDYPGEYDTIAEGEQYAAVRVEELRAQAEVFHGSGNERDLSVGRRFKLDDHPRRDLNIEYLVTSTSIVVEEEARESGTGGAFSYSMSFTAIPAAQPFRPPRITPKPVVQGVQTAVVVGPPGAEIHTDELGHGRIRVQFHWDRYGERNDKSSCWLRVATPWAGKGFGAISLPRVGDEVVVSFEEGDPDRPLVIGSVFNGDNRTPWKLPDNATQSGIFTRSSKGGSAGTANAIRFEDKKGAEELWLHAERDQRIEVEHDERHTVGRNRTKTVQASETNGIGGDQSTQVGGNRTVTVGRAAAETVALAKALTIGGAYQVTVGAVMNETVVGAKATEVGGFRYEKVAGYKRSEIGKSLTFEAGDEVVIKTGDASLTMKKDGTIEIVGKSITLKTGGGSVEIKDDGKIAATGTDTTMKTTAGRVNIDPGGIITIKGPMVRINT